MEIVQVISFLIYMCVYIGRKVIYDSCKAFKEQRIEHHLKHFGKRTLPRSWTLFTKNWFVLSPLGSICPKPNTIVLSDPLTANNCKLSLHRINIQTIRIISVIKYNGPIAGLRSYMRELGINVKARNIFLLVVYATEIARIQVYSSSEKSYESSRDEFQTYKHFFCLSLMWQSLQG